MSAPVLDRVAPAHIHPDPDNRRPAVRPVSHLFTARWAQFERIAVEIVEDFDVERYRRASRIHSEWAQRYAELNDPEQARECHGISVALDQRAQLIRRYPGEFTDTLAVLADIFDEQQSV